MDPEIEIEIERETTSNYACSLNQPFLDAQLALPSTSTSTSTFHLPQRTKSKLHRVNTAPAISVLPSSSPISNRSPHASSSILLHALLYLLAYLSIGITFFYLASPDGFTGPKTHFSVDAVYFCIVTLCTIGYGDIAPNTALTKAFACLFVLVGFGLIDVLLSGAVSYMLDAQEAAILAGAQDQDGVFVDATKGRMRIRMKVALAIAAAIVSIGVGTIALYLIEDLSWIDSLYVSVMSVTTVGYGDKAFKTLYGRVFASVWLLVSTLAVARAFLFLAEARIDKRHRHLVKWILQRDLTVDDLLAADINRNGYISKSEFIIYKLKEMGKIGEKDVLLIVKQFEKLDCNHTGKITLPGLLSTKR